MKRCTFFFAFFAFAILIQMVPVAHAFTSVTPNGDIEAISLGIASTNTVCFNDSYVDKVKMFREEGDTWYEEYTGGKFAATFKLDLSSIFPASETQNITKQFNGTTCFSIVVGAVMEEFCLGDGGDVKYTEGKANATVARKEDVGEEREKWITVMKTTVKWTKKNVLTIKISGNAAWVGWILADNYDGTSEPAITDTVITSVMVTGTFIDNTSADITSFYATSDVAVTGNSDTKPVVKGPDQEEFELTTVKLTGKGTVTVGYDL